MDRITIISGLCGGRPTIRGMRIKVADVLDMFAAGMTTEEILESFPDLEIDDLKACFAWAARSADHLIVAPA